VRASSLGYVPGYVFFVQDATLFARPFDEKRLEFSGEPIRLLDGIPVTPPGRAPFSVSPTGLLAYWTYPGGTSAVLRWVERDGRKSAAVDTPAKYVGFSVSPDGRRAVVSRRADDGGANLWVRDLARGTEDQLTFDGAAYTPQWSADGARIVFTGPGRTPPPKLFIKSFAEKSVEGPIGSVSMPNFASAWSRDGESIISVRMDPANGNDLWVERLREHVAERLSVNTASNESQGKLSPDDRWIAYVTDESGRDEVWVASFPAGDVRRQVSVGGGTSPEWGAEGREVFYVSNDKRLIVVPINGGDPGVEVGSPRPLFVIENLVETEQRVMPTSNSYAATLNGQRFLVAVRVRDPSTPPIRILVNWRSLLKH
jgi:Tol biopolymer transport system component